MYSSTTYGVSKYSNINSITCYMNSNLHILQQTPLFVDYISQRKFENSITKKVGKSKRKIKKFVIHQLFKLFNKSLKNDDGIITPTKFKKLVGQKNDMWDENNHQDAQEFINFLISQLEEEVGTKTMFIPGSKEIIVDNRDVIKSFDIVNSTISKYQYQSREFSIMKELFNGMIATNKKCIYCKSSSLTFEPFTTLSITIPIKSKKHLDKDFHLYECLDEFIKEEQLDKDNKMNCNLCGFKNRGKTRTTLWETPKILIIHIKRFLVNSFGIKTSKITNNVEYPIDLDLTKYFNKNSIHSNTKYQLFGINLHHSIGQNNNINFGHYVSIVRNMINGKWHLFNDDKPIIELNEEHIQNKNAYMLFYYRI